MQFALLAIHFGFWCSCIEPSVKIAEYATLQECEKAKRDFLSHNSDELICSRISLENQRKE